MLFGRDYLTLNYIRKMYKKQLTPKEVKELVSLERKLKILIDNRDSMLKSLNHTLTELFEIELKIEKIVNV